MIGSLDDLSREARRPSSIVLARYNHTLKRTHEAHERWVKADKAMVASFKRNDPGKSMDLMRIAQAKWGHYTRALLRSKAVLNYYTLLAQEEGKLP